MTDKDIKELEEKAGNATPGPWRFGQWKHRNDLSKKSVSGFEVFPYYEYSRPEEHFDNRCFSTAEYGIVSDSERNNILDSQPTGPGDETDLDIKDADAYYIATANPTAILSLIERLRRCEEALNYHDGSSADATGYFEKWRRG